MLICFGHPKELGLGLGLHAYDDMKTPYTKLGYVYAS